MARDSRRARRSARMFRIALSGRAKLAGPDVRFQELFRIRKTSGLMSFTFLSFRVFAIGLPFVRSGLVDLVFVSYSMQLG